MKGVHALPVPGLEGEVDVGDRPVGPVDPEFVAGEMLRAFPREVAPEGLQDGAVEAPACLEIRDAQMNVVDQAALMELHGFHSNRSKSPATSSPALCR